jgi:hypothetical protein
MPRKRVEATELQRMFNADGLWGQVQSGILKTKLMANKHPAPERSGQPFCTRSQIVMYLSEDEEVARVHQYLRPDGTIGASGLPDPKRMIRAGVIYYV